ncbi:BIG1-domain-containing protein [Plenodomus tracheiphilus IPT5]|uniref:Protein BIG1 n=1 Tax=Plenodomus tracheiphilus IPT5 TaxID=1408161 RepID=A0A6A7BGN2_9PLEO|nr:BIG1-domain-containing protein [Plenodomus tracheiphilus IPT5]
MAKSLVGALALAALPSALAFRNTSPFFLLSSADLHMPSTQGSIADSASITARVLDALHDCPTSSYLILEQEGVSSDDFADPRSAPHLSKLTSGAHAGVKTTFATPEVVGQVDVAAIKKLLQSHCAPQGADSEAWVQSYVSRELANSPHLAHRKEKLINDDTVLGDYIFDTAKEHDFTVIYITSPQTESQAKIQLEQYTYESTFPDTMQMELKRDLSAHQKQSNATEGGLFEHYQFFTPGIFMGFIAIIPLFLILLVGVRALTSLEVSYFAFSKEMGPNAQKRQQ